MKVDLYILAFSAVTVLVTIWMGFRSAKKSKTASDFFVAGRSVSVGWNASAISGEYLSAASFMGIAGMVMSSGYDALWYPVCYACGYLFLLLFIAGPLRRFGAYTIPDFAEGRFDSPVFRKIAVVFVLFIGFFYTMPQMKGAGTTLAYIFPGLPYWAGVVLVGAVITLNVALGGMKGITLVQAFQYWAKMFAISVPIFVLMAVYGHYGKQVGANGGNLESRTSNSELGTNAAAPFEFQTFASALRDSMTWQERLGRARAKARGIFQQQPQGTNLSVAGLIRFQSIDGDRAIPAYEALTGRTLLKANILYPIARFSYTNSAGVTLVQAAQELEAAFAKEDWHFLHVDEYTTIVAPRSRTNEIWQYVSTLGLSPREPLPAKAPADATWLNPFGPLTTKAAKNAAAALAKKQTTAIDIHSPVFRAHFDEFALNTTTLSEDIKVAWRTEEAVKDKAASALAEARGLYTDGMRSMNVLQAIGAYNHVTRAPVFPLKNLITPEMSEQKPWPGFRKTMSRHDYAQLLETFLGSNGVALIHDPTGTLAVPAALKATLQGAYDRGGLAALTDSLPDWRGVSGSTSAVPVSTSLTLKAVNGWVTLEPPTRIDRAEDRIKAVFGQAQHYSVGNAKLVSVLMEYAHLSGEVVLAHTNIELTRLLGSLELDWNQRRTLIADMERFLGTNGVALRKEKPGVVRAMTLEQAAQWEQAGANSTATVAGAARRGGDTAPYLSLPLRSDITPDQRLTVALDSPTVAQALAVYAELTGRKLVPNTNSVAERVDDLLSGKLSKLKLITRGAAPDNGVRFHNDGLFTAGQVKAAIEEQLRTNGLAVVAIGDKAFAVERAARGTLASPTLSAEKAWLAKHEKPLALLYTYSLIIAIVCGTAGLPHILVRFYTNPDGVAAKRTTMWVMILIGVFYVFPPVFGTIGRNLFPDLYAATGAKGTDKIVLELPRILNERYAPLGSVLSGITCAGAFAAFMSTFSGLLVSMTGALAHDVYGRILRPKATADERMRMFKIGAVIIGGVAILLGMQVEQLQINFMVGQAFAIAAASYFPLLFMAVWWRKLTMKGAASGMLTGGLAALTCISLTSFSDLASAPKASAFFQLFAGLNPFWAAHPLLRILCEQPAIWAVPLAITLMFIVSKLTAREVPGDIRMKMLVLHAPEELGLKQEYIQEHQHGH